MDNQEARPNENRLATAPLWRAIDALLYTMSIIGIAYCLYLVFMYVPNERIMGPIQRIFYFHVGSATACYVSFGIVFFGSVLFLATRKERFDVLSHAAGEVGFVFCTIVLITGMIWGQAAWNTWFRFEPRLVSFLLLWMIFLAFTLLRFFGEPGKIATHSAVLGIIGAITVPLMVYSVKLLPAAAQLHPQVIENQGLRDPRYYEALFYTTGMLVIFQFLLLRLRYRIELFSRILR